MRWRFDNARCWGLPQMGHFAPERASRRLLSKEWVALESCLAKHRGWLPVSCRATQTQHFRGALAVGAADIEMGDRPHSRIANGIQQNAPFPQSRREGAALKTVMRHIV